MKLTKPLSLFIAAILLFCSCGAAGGDIETVTADAAETAAAETTTGRADNLPPDLEFCAAKSYAEIMPAYLEDALKNKYIRDLESVETINMLTVHPLSDFGALYLDLGFYSFLRFDVKDENIASAIEKKAKTFAKNLEKMLVALEGG
jgi:hypothetical protein